MTSPKGVAEIIFTLDTFEISTDMQGKLFKYEFNSRIGDLLRRLDKDIPSIQWTSSGGYGNMDRSIYSVHQVYFMDNLRNYPDNIVSKYWEQEIENIRAMRIRLYGIKCLDIPDTDHDSPQPYGTLGHYVQLFDSKQLLDFLMAERFNDRGAELMQGVKRPELDRQRFEYDRPSLRYNDVMKRLFRNPHNGDTRNGYDDSVYPYDSVSSLEFNADHTRAIPVFSALKSRHEYLQSRLKAYLAKSASVTTATGVLKYQKKRVTTKRRTKEKTSLHEYRLENLPRHRREDVPEKNFLLAEIPWSKWQLVMSLGVKHECCQKRVGDKTGYKAKQILDGKTKRPALYEIAVQPKYRCRKFVVYSKNSQKGFRANVNWERNLFRRKDIREQIESALIQGCNIFVRRAWLKNTRYRGWVRESLKRYDYAWSVIRSERTSHRRVTKAGVIISEEVEV